MPFELCREKLFEVDEAEYVALRQEVVEWQGRRMTTTSATVVVVTAVLGWIVQAPDRWAWPNGSAILLVAVASAALLTWIFGLNAIRLGTYLQIFHETSGARWESRNARFRGKGYANLNAGLALVYLALGAISIAVPRIVATRPPTAASYVVFGLALACAAAAIALVVQAPRRRSQAAERWRKLRAEELERGSVGDEA